MVEVAKKRPEVGTDVIAAIQGIPYEVLAPNAALLIASLEPVANLREPVLGALRALATQPKNEALKKAAASRLAGLESRGAAGLRR